MRAVSGETESFRRLRVRQITINLIGNATVDRKQTGFIEFRFADVQRRFPPVVVADRQVQQLPTPDSRREQQNDGEADDLWAQRR